MKFTPLVNWNESISLRQRPWHSIYGVPDIEANDYPP